MHTPAPAYHLFVGVDIAATSFAAAWICNAAPPQRARTFVQTPDGFAAYVKSEVDRWAVIVGNSGAEAE